MKYICYFFEFFNLFEQDIFVAGRVAHVGIDQLAVFVVQEDIRAGGDVHGPAQLFVHVEGELEVVPAAAAHHGLGLGQRTGVVGTDGNETEGLLSRPLFEHLTDCVHLFQTGKQGSYRARS